MTSPPDPSPSRLAKVTPREAWGPNSFGILVAQGKYDIHGLEAEYLAQVSGGEVAEGDGESEQVMWCGLPDGGIGEQACWRGWEEEAGSEEEVEFLAAVAEAETDGLGLEGIEMDELDLSIRSHILLPVMQAAVKDRQERERFLGSWRGGWCRRGKLARRGQGVQRRGGRCCGGSWWRMRSSLHAGGCHLLRSSSLLSWGRGSKGFRRPLDRRVGIYVCTYRVKHPRPHPSPIFPQHIGQ